MPHFIVEHSANLSESHDLQVLADLIRDAAVETGVFPLAGIRVRFHSSEIYTIADGHHDNAFLAIVVRLGAGRDTKTKQQAGKRVFDVVCDFFGDFVKSGHMMVSLDMDENNPELSFKANSVHQRMNQ